MESKKGRQTASIIGVITALIHFFALMYMLNKYSSDAHGFIILIFIFFDFPLIAAAYILDFIIPIDVNISSSIKIETVLLIFGTIWWYFVPKILYKSYYFIKHQFCNFKVNVNQGNINLKKWGLITLVLLLIGLSLL